MRKTLVVHSRYALRCQRARYRAQVRDYLRATGARTGLIVYLTSGWVDRNAAA